MSAKDTITSALELLTVVLLLVGFIHEETLIALEDRIARRAAKLAVAVGAAARRYLERTEVTPMAYSNPCPRCGRGNLDSGETWKDCPSCQAEISKAIVAAPNDAHSVAIILPPTERQERRTP